MGLRLVFANEKLCNHIRAFDEMGYISWTMNHVKFEVGDVVYVFLSKVGEVKSKRSIRYKTVEEECNLDREDRTYWENGTAPADKTYRLRLLERYEGNLLTEARLKEHGFKGGRSLQRPIKNNPQLFEYITSVF